MKQQLLGSFAPEEIDAKVREKQARLSGLLTEEAALRLVAKDQGLPLPVVEAHVTSLSKASEGDVTVRVRVQAVQSPKRFERDGRSGQVCNVHVADASGSASLVFWNQDVSALSKIRRNDVLLVKDAFVKSTSPLEIHARLSSEILVQPDDSSLPKSPVQVVSLAGAQGEEFDVSGRILDKEELKTFEKNGRKGSLLRLELSDGFVRKVLVAWDANAEAALGLSVGEAVTVESAYGKNGEIHASWRGRLMRSDTTSLPPIESLLPSKTLDALSSENALVSATVDGVFDAQRYFKCTVCGSKSSSPECSCGGTGKEIRFVALSLKDASLTCRGVLFGQAAREFLGATDTLPWPTLLALKRDYLVGKPLRLVAQGKVNSVSGKPEVVGLHVVSVKN